MNNDNQNINNVVSNTNVFANSVVGGNGGVPNSNAVVNPVNNVAPMPAPSNNPIAVNSSVEASAVTTGDGGVPIIPVSDDMSEDLKKAVNYLNKHRFDLIGADAEGEVDDEANFFADIANEDSSSTTTAIVEDENTTENFDDIGLF